MKCLTIQQPWAHAIFNQGKDMENRSWRTKYRGPLLIHAGVSRKNFTAAGQLAWGVKYPGYETDHEKNCKFGAIIGVCCVIGCEPSSFFNKNLWSTGSGFGWQLSDAFEFLTPVPLKGKQGLFNVPDDLVTEQIKGWRRSIK